MATPSNETAFRKRMQRVEELLQEVESYTDPTARTHTHEIVQTLMDFHGIGLERILHRVAEEGEAGRRILDCLGDDELVSSLLLLYGLHPLSTEERIARALENAGPSLTEHGGSVEFVALIGGSVRVRLNGSCDGTPASALTLKTMIEEAILNVAPEVASIEIEDNIAHSLILPNMDGRTRMALPLLSR